MLSRRRKLNENYSLSLAFYRALDYSVLDHQGFVVLSLIRWISSLTNSGVKPARILELMSRTSGDRVSNILVILSNLGFVLSTGYSNDPYYLVTDKGEDYLKGVEIQLSRLINQSKLARWKAIKSPDDPRYKFLRSPNYKGAKRY